MSSAKKSATPSNKSAKAKKKREEEERKKKDEEEAQQRAEIAEKERLENDRRQADERKSAAKEINELRRRELAEFFEFLQPREEQANKMRQKQRDEFQWKRLMICDGTPDPTVLREINTFISLWRDEQHLEMTHTMKQTNLVFSLINELHYVIHSIPVESSEIERIPIYRKTIHELEDVVHDKWLQTTHYMMLRATDLQDLETNNFQYAAENENATLCIWANLSHNLKIENYHFDKYLFGFTIPKPLALANIAIVGFFLKYDYYSERSPLSKCRTRIQEYSYDPIPEPLVEETVKPVVDEAEKDDFDSSLPPELRKLMEQSKQREEPPAAADTSANNNPTSTDGSNAQASADDENKSKNLTKTSFGEKKSLDDDPTTTVTADQILEELADEAIIDLRSHWPLLPLIQIGLYNIPPQPKKVQDWTIMEVDPDNFLVPYPYPSDPMIAERFYEEDSLPQKNKTETEGHKGKADEKTDEIPDPSVTLDGTMIANNPEVRRFFLAAAAKQESPLAIKFKIPNDIYVTEKPLLARWIKDKKHWRQEGYANYQYTPDTRTISFKTYDFGTYALLNDRHSHMPFQSWRLRPKSTNHVLFTLNTASFEITLEVRNDKVAIFLPPRKVEVPVEEKPVSIFASKLIKPAVQSTSSLSTSRAAADEGTDIYKTNPTLAAIIEPIANQFMTIRELIQKLRSVGLNIFPEPDSESYVSVINKNHKLEWLVYNQMAIVASSTAFSYSHWNAFVNDEMKIVVGCKEYLIDQSTVDDDLPCIIFTSELVGMTDICESSQEFVEASTFSDYHSELFHLVREKFSSEAFARVLDTNPLFVETLQQLLQTIKPLTYA